MEPLAKRELLRPDGTPASFDELRGDGNLLMVVFRRET